MEIMSIEYLRRLTRGWGLWAALGLVLSGVACYPGEGPTNVQDLDVVLTVHDEKVDFGAFQTYAMPDTVVHVSSDQGDDILDLPRTYDELVLELVSENMADAGYTRELNPENNGADLILLVEAIGSKKTDYWVSGGWWDYWGWYPGWGYPGYPGYGPGWEWGYPPNVGSVSFEQGTIVLTLVDPNRGEAEELPVIWAGAARGLLGYGGATARITNSINRMFSQSPYLSR